MADFDSIGEQTKDVGFLDRGGSEDAGPGGVAGNLRDGEPAGRSEAGRGVEAEAAAADRLPLLARRVAAACQAVGVGEGEGQREACPLAPLACGEFTLSRRGGG